MFKSTLRFLSILLLASLGVYLHTNIGVVKFVMFNYEVEINFLVFVLLSFVLIKTVFNIYSIVYWTRKKISKLFSKKKK
ncbi:MAG: hypothetical protein LBU68_01645 [Rickettsiales bacterium]|jgi:hypothetical protein|nr:hypothetical protein [Rickettsiales bacterium]